MEAATANHSWWRKYYIELFIVILGLIAINLIFFADAYRETDTINPETAGQLGDFVGGYIGSFFVLVSVVLLYSTLSAQRRASQLNNFETKYFELLKMHRDNVAELGLQDASGRKIFVLLIRELRSILSVVKTIADRYQLQLTQQELLHVSYYCLFYGTGPNSSRMLKISLSNFKSDFVEALEKELDKKEVKEQAKKDRKFGYVPFEGHQSRLGHYYRHLYQTVCYVDKQTIDINKYEYVKTIRAQLTTHEQALLLVNSLTPIGRNWWKKNLITKYKLVKNIPNHFFEESSELDTSNIFETGYFEWDEVAATTH